MTNREKDSLRKLQDNYVKKLYRMGFKENDVIIEDGILKITVDDLYKYLYPEYKSIFQSSDF